MRNINPKCRTCRRTGTKLFLKGVRCYGQKCALIKRNYPPGAHGQSPSKGRLSEYGVQLREKQKMRYMYGLSERQFRRFVTKALKMKGVTGDVLMSLLERRLDSILLKAGIAESRESARQFVNHGNVFVNGSKVSIPSYLVKAKDVITFRMKGKLKDMVEAALKKNVKSETLPAWISFDAKKNQVEVTSLPKLSSKDIGIDSQLIVEFYSR